jgi:hypothetical protein
MFGQEMFFAYLENNMEYHEEHHESRRDPLPENQNNSKQKSQLPKEPTKPINDKNCKHFLQESVDKLTKPSNSESPYKKNIIQNSQSSSQQDVSSMSIYEISCNFPTNLHDSKPILLIVQDM